MARSVPRREWVARRQLEDLGLIVDQHVRLADVVKVSGRGLGNSDFRWACAAHADLLVRDADTGEPQAVIEVDGMEHREAEQARRDRLKDRLLEDDGVDVIRVLASAVNNVHGKKRLVSYLANLWLSSRAFTDAQEAGSVPWDEVFFHSFTFQTNPDTGRLESMDPSLRFLARIVRLRSAGRLPSRLIHVHRYIANLGLTELRAFLPLSVNRFLYADSAIARFRIPGVAPSQVAEEVALLELEHDYDAWVAGGAVARDTRELDRLWPRPVLAGFGPDGSWSCNSLDSDFMCWLSQALGRRVTLGLRDGRPFYEEGPLGAS